MKQFTVEARLKHGEKVVTGGICEFFDPNLKKKAVFMIHQDDKGRVTVSEIEPSTIKGVFGSWQWMFDWLEQYERHSDIFFLKDFKEWTEQQPTAAE